ncbi:MAG: AAA family ATPase [Bacteroidales bacterium]|nr:AAA family ATPase [Bacteroidales bacterium]
MIYIKKLVLEKPLEERVDYPYDIPAIHLLNELEFSSDITFLVGENGIGKSTLIEALAICAGFNPEGGSTYLRFNTYDTHSVLYQDLKIVRSTNRNTDGFFLRAESFYNIASELDRITDKDKLYRNYGGAIHCKSHGEGFMSVVMNRLSGNGLYIFDEPESALSVHSQLQLLVKMRQLQENQSQFIIATHSPILLAYPGATIYHISEDGFAPIQYEDTEQYKMTKLFLLNYQSIINKLLVDD